MFTLLCHERFLISMLVRSFIVRILILTQYNSLADKIERVGTATETAIGSFKAIQTGERSNGSVVGGGVVKYEVAEVLGVR
jgi:hypothetical protein